MAKELRSKRGAPIAKVFTFLSGLYFRGKIAYANTFAQPADASSGIFIITPTRGLVDARARMTLRDLHEFAAVDIHQNDPRFRKPLRRHVRRLARQISPKADVVLLGSIATRKYIDVLLETFRERLLFPADFVGRGDMSRGGLLLRCAADRQELQYVSIVGAVLKGKRPPKLTPRRYPREWP